MLRPKSPQSSFYGSYLYDRIVPADHLSGTAVVTSDNGTQVGSITYYPYGSTRSGSVPTDKKFTGQRLDDTGLYYYGARYYDATIGRFISPDIIVQNPANPQTFNRYSYVLNNPLRYVDPSGNIVNIGNTGLTPDELLDVYFEDDAMLGFYAQTATGILLGDWAEFEDKSPGYAEMLEESESVITFKGVADELRQSDRSIAETVGQILFDAVGQRHTAVNTLLGVKLATMSGSASLRFGPGGTLLFEDIDKNSFTGLFMEYVLKTSTFTVGYVILTGFPEIPSGAWEHESGHVTQYAIGGANFIPAYIYAHLKYGKANNPFEIWEPKWPRR